MKLDEKKLHFENYNAKFYKYRQSLYKVFKHYVPESLENQILYNHSIQSHLDKHLILPTKILTDERSELIGYKMRFVDGTNFESELIHSHLSFEDKILLINELFRLLKEIHQYLIVGDIRNSNLMVGKDGNAYMIDFDLAKKVDSPIAPVSRYHIYSDDEILNDQNEDLIKLFISALSLLYEIDIEEHFINFGTIEKLADYIPLSGVLKYYYHYLKKNVYTHNKSDIYLNIHYYEELEKEVNVARSRLLTK